MSTMGSSRSSAGFRPDPAESRWENDVRNLMMESRKIRKDSWGSRSTLPGMNWDKEFPFLRRLP